jgi:hypothetical protein
MYTEATSCPFPIYADPSKCLYSQLGMARTLSLGSSDPDYIHHPLAIGVVKSIVQGLTRVGKGDVLKAGDIRQVGGEFMFEDGKVTWCHRMRNTRDHAEAPVLKKVLGLRDGNDERPPPKRRWTASLTRLGSTRRPSYGERRSDTAGRKSTSRSPSKGHSPRRAQTTVSASNEGSKELSTATETRSGSKPSPERIISGDVTKEPDSL